MKNLNHFFLLPFALILALFITGFSDSSPDKDSLKFPYKKAGLSDRQAAAHMLSRFTYGARPGDIDAVLEMGMETWFQKQLKADFPDNELDQLLSGFDAINLSNSEVTRTFPKNAQLLRMAIRDGVIDKNAVNTGDRQEYRKQIAEYMQQKGLRPQAELMRQLISQKIIRASYSNNQMQEVLTDFWFNHFNVSITKNQCAEFIPAYERDIVRPNVSGKFSNLLVATAKSPAMLFYLDNFSSSGEMGAEMNEVKAKALKNMKAANPNSPLLAAAQKRDKRGLNENYAREVMELHTLGVDGGYSQADVTNAARVLTGWTISPAVNSYNADGKKLLDKLDQPYMKKQGFVHEGDFLFAPNRHDQGEKVVLGKKFSGGGYQEGLALLNMLADHPSTAKFISKKLAIRFVNDQPSEKLVNRMAAVFEETDGNIAEVLKAMVSSQEFWTENALREKTKSPFELAISAVRLLDADVRQAQPLATWINKMGQNLYSYQAPTGYPDNGQFWINSGSLLNRMNFGLAIASARIPGVTLDIAAMNRNREPESAQAALSTYGKLLMPERDLTNTIARLSPMLNDPDLEKKIGEAADKKSQMSPQAEVLMDGSELAMGNGRNIPARKSAKMATKDNPESQMLARVVGVIIGSPEFQRK